MIMEAMDMGMAKASLPQMETTMEGIIKGNLVDMASGIGLECTGYGLSLHYSSLLSSVPFCGLCSGHL